MADSYVFVANGDSCPICAGLDGSFVPAGFKAHAGCTCNTVKMDDGERTCEFEYSENNTYFNGSYRGFRVQLDLTITCPDGSTHTATGYDVGLDTLSTGDSDDTLEDWAHEACDQFCDQAGSPGDEFLCC
ncbi:MAG TPA: hypothetical protein PLL50_07270 [Propionicimonas sp.]|nr:hypothetical protein [Propionicimonas sp.]HQA78141.1 hypothetical protein [Propionicimonas sp.]HQD98038.1 hypothetical protein [Propionicimonas sp.]